MPWPSASLSSQRAILLLERSHALERPRAPCLRSLLREPCTSLGDFRELRVDTRNVIQRLLARHRLDSAHAGGHAGFADDVKQSDIARAAHMRAAAQLGREIADRQHPHLALVLLTEQRHGALGHRLLVIHQARGCLRVGADLRVDQPLDLRRAARR